MDLLWTYRKTSVDASGFHELSKIQNRQFSAYFAAISVKFYLDVNGMAKVSNGVETLPKISTG